MNLKYYLRGLGVGIVVTSLILGIGLGSREEALSNEEIKERARALGMVEESSITVAEAAAQPEEEAADDPGSKDDAGSELKDDTADKAAAEPVASASPEAGATPKATDDPAETREIMDITINPGEGSYAVSRKLEQSGLIDDASEYVAYLCDSGYHTRLRAGAHKIPMGSTREEIAKLLCQ